jgi:hypothetical protein
MWALLAACFGVLLGAWLMIRLARKIPRRQKPFIEINRSRASRPPRFPL